MNQTYNAYCEKIVDGDTLDIVIDQGLGTYREIRIRLANVDTHETYGVSHDSDEYTNGIEEKRYVKSWIDDCESEWPLTAVIHKRGKYGRFITTLKRDDGRVLNDDIATTFPSTSR